MAFSLEEMAGAMKTLQLGYRQGSGIDPQRFEDAVKTMQQTVDEVLELRDRVALLQSYYDVMSKLQTSYSQESQRVHALFDQSLQQLKGKHHPPPFTPVPWPFDNQEP